MLVTQKLRNLLNGVSQRPQTERLSSQASEQINGLSHPATGVRKRPPSTHLGKLTDDVTGWDDAFIHSINRDEDQRYHVIIADQDIFVYDAFTQEEIPVVKPFGTDYLYDPYNKGFRAVTVGDTMVIVNRGFIAKRGATKTPVAAFEALLSIRQADFSTLYAVTLNGIRIGIRTIDAATPAARVSISTDAVASDLLTAILADATLAADFDFTLYGSTIHVARKNAKDFTLTTSDGLADRGLQAVKGQIQTFEDLPARAPAGFVVEVTGSLDTSKDNYFVKFDDLGLPQQAGVWRECPKPGTLIDFDRLSMPHRLTLRGDLIITPPVGTDPDPVPVTTTPHEGLHGAIGQFALLSASTEQDWDETLDPNGHVIPNGSNVVFSNSGVRKTATDAAKKVDVFYRLDIAALAPGDIAVVALYKNGVLQADRPHTNAGQPPVDPTQPPPITDLFPPDDSNLYSLSFDTLAVDDIVELRVEFATSPPNPISVATLIVQGGSFQIHPFIVKRLTILNALFPSTTEVEVTLDGTDTFTHTIGDTDETGVQVTTALKALIEAHADYITAAGLTSSDFTIRRTDDANYTSTIVATFDDAVTFHNRSLNLTPDELVGRTLRNISDGCEGLVVSNTVTTITVDDLLGGANNVFVQGDLCTVGNAAPTNPDPLDPIPPDPLLADLYWVFEPIPWKNRAVGDLDVVPFPSFMDSRISDVFFYQNRLGFLSNENVVMSSSGDLFNLFRYTATDLRADDMIDVRSSHAAVTLFDSAVLWAKSLYIKSDNMWFQCSGGETVLTPSTIRLDAVGQFPSSKDPRPVVVGDRVYFTRSKSGQSQVFEGLIVQDSEGKNTLRVQEITLDLPTYIQGVPLEMVGDSAEGFIALLTDDNSQRSLYIHSFQFIDGRKIQSSWSRWDFAADTRIVGIDMIDGVLGMVVKRNDGGYVEQINLDLTPNAAEKVAYLDRRVFSENTPSGWLVAGNPPEYAAGPDTTTWTLPYAIATNGSQGVVQVTNRTTGEIYAVTRPSTTTVAVTGEGDLTTALVFIGVQYEFLYHFSTIYLRNQENDEPETGGRLQIRSGSLHFIDTTDFTMTVTLDERSARGHDYTVAAPTDAIFKRAILGQNTASDIVLTNDTPGPCVFSKFDWEGFYVTRARRL